MQSSGKPLILGSDFEFNVAIDVLHVASESGRLQGRREEEGKQSRTARRAVDEGESVTDPKSSKSKVISSVSLFLRLLSPFHGESTIILSL